MSALNLRELRNEVIDLVDAGIGVIIKSPPGIGKSDMMRSIIEYLSKRDGEDWGHCEMFPAQYTPPDVIGYQFKGEKTFTINGKEQKVTVTDPTLPLWMQTYGDGRPAFGYKRGIVVIDEWGQGEADVKRAMAQLLLCGEAGPWRLPKGWGRVALSNRANDRSGVTKEFDHIINRVCILEGRGDINVWVEDFALPYGVLPVLIAWAKDHPGVVFSDEVPEKQGPWCTARSVTKLNDVLKVKAKRLGYIPDDPATQVTASGIVGGGSGQSIFAHIKLDREMPSVESILKDPEGVKVPNDASAQMLVVYKLAHHANDKTIGPMTTYVKRMPKEFAVPFAKAAVTRSPLVINSPAIQKWCAENSALMAQIAKVAA